MSTANIFDLADTWNDAATTFTAIKMNVTDTASNAASNLLDLQVGGVSQFRVQKNGNVLMGTAAKIVAFPAGNNTLTLAANDGASQLSITHAGQAIIARLNNVDVFRGGRLTGFTVASFNPSIRFSAGDINLPDLDLIRDAADTLAQRRLTNPQAFKLYNTFTDASNFERLAIRWDSNALEIKPEAGGTGSTRVLHISGLPTSNPGPGILWNDGGDVKVGT